jgi:polysaccharide biosynthesis protein PslH
VSKPEQLVVLDITSYKYLKPKTGGHLGIYYPLQALGKYCKLLSAGVVENDAQAGLTYESLPIFRGGAGRYINPIYFFRLKNIIKTHKVQAILLQHCYFAWLAILLKKFCKVKLVMRSHNVEYLRFKSMGKTWWPILKKYEHWCLKHSDMVMCVTLDDEAIYKQQVINPIYNAFPFGTNLENADTDILHIQQKIKQQYNIQHDERLILYNGTLGYAPNRHGLDFILEKLNPLLQASNLKYKILICGSGLPAEYQALRAYAAQNIIYAGFVENVADVFKAADVFVNPVIGGGGIKTKLIEAIAYGTTVVSSTDGAIGFVEATAPDKIIICTDDDAQEMCNAVLKVLQSTYKPTPQSFYDYYNWNTNAQKAIQAMQQLIQHK